MQSQCQHCLGQPRSWRTVRGTKAVACADLPRPQPCGRTGQRVRGRVGRIGPSRSEMECILVAQASAVCAPRVDQKARNAKARCVFDFLLESHSGQEYRDPAGADKGGSGWTQ